MNKFIEALKCDPELQDEAKKIQQNFGAICIPLRNSGQYCCEEAFAMFSDIPSGEDRMADEYIITQDGIYTEC